MAPVLVVGAGTGTAIVVTLVPGKGSAMMVLVEVDSYPVPVVSEQGTSVVYELVTVTGAGEDTLMVQGQAKRSY